MKRPYPFLAALTMTALMFLAPLSLEAAPGDEESSFRQMPPNELNAYWQDAFGTESFQTIEPPRYVQPGGRYGSRIFYHSEPGSVRLEGTGAAGKLFIGGQTFNYRAAIHPFAKDSAISYFRITENNDFGALIGQQFPGLEARTRTEDGKWNLLSIGDELGIPLEMGSYFADWTNLPNFQWVLSSILVRRASQQGDGQVLLLDQGHLRSIDQSSIQAGGNKSAVITALYDPAAMENIGGAGKFPLWMLLAAAGGGLLIGGLVFFFLGRRRKSKRGSTNLAQGEAMVLEEDPRFVNLYQDLDKPLEPKDLLKVLSMHFDDSQNVASALTQTKLLIDKGLKAGNSSNIGTASESAGETTESTEAAKGGKIKISMSNQGTSKSPSTETEVPQEEAPVQEEPQKEIQPEVRNEAPPHRPKEPEVREVIREVIKEVVIKETPNKDKLLVRLANQETAEEKLLAAVSFWDAEFEMEGKMNEELKTVVRGYRTLKRVKEGFEDQKLRSALNTLALSFGGGHTETVKRLMDRSDIIDQFVNDIEADSKAPEALRTDDRGKTAGQFAELIRAMGCMDRIARRELGQKSVADYGKAIENLMNGFLLDGIARDVDGNKPYEEIKVRLDGRLGLFRDDVRFAKHQIPADALARAHKIVLGFAGQAGGTEYYKAYMARYGDLYDKLSQYEDPPNLEQLREWWSQVFEMVIHAFDYFRYSMNPKESNLSKLNVMLVTEGLKLHQLPEGDVKPFSERVTEVPRAVRNAREMARSIGISRLDKVLIEGFYVHPKALKPVE